MRWRRLLLPPGRCWPPPGHNSPAPTLRRAGTRGQEQLQVSGYLDICRYVDSGSVLCAITSATSVDGLLRRPCHVTAAGHHNMMTQSQLHCCLIFIICGWSRFIIDIDPEYGAECARRGEAECVCIY